jgi:hypothetical protein
VWAKTSNFIISFTIYDLRFTIQGLMPTAKQTPARCLRRGVIRRLVQKIVNHPS